MVDPVFGARGIIRDTCAAGHTDFIGASSPRRSLFQRLEREFAGPVFHRGEQCTLARRTEQSGRELAPGGATDENASCSASNHGLRPALPQHACRCPQHIQPTAASCLSLNSPDLPIRCGCAMARRNRRRMKPSPVHPSSAETAQLDNAPARNTWYHVLPRRDDDARFRGTPTKRNDPLNLANASPSEAQARTTVQPTPRTYASQSR